jgi:ribosomal protein L3 glutamine methyltransferase
MSFMPVKYKKSKAAKQLVTVRDFLRYGVTIFNDANIEYGHGTDNAYDEAAFMILESLQLSVDQLEPWLDCALTKAERKMIANILHERVATRKPASYIVNRAYIQGYPFYVDERVIVPRSFIGEIIMGVQSPLTQLVNVDTILDLCTGSGCLAILASELYEEAVIDAVDLSSDALAVAAKNVEFYAADERINLIQSDLFTNLDGRKYDLIITNPPYVDMIGMAVLGQEFEHEPEMALYGGSDDGMDLVRVIINEALEHLNPNGAMILELGRGQASIVSEYPHLNFQWLNTANSEGEVFFITAVDLKKGLEITDALNQKNVTAENLASQNTL